MSTNAPGIPAVVKTGKWSFWIPVLSDDEMAAVEECVQTILDFFMIS